MDSEYFKLNHQACIKVLICTISISLNLIYLKAKPAFIGILNHIIKTFISNKNVDDFDYNELKQRLLDCGFDSEEIRQMEGLGREIYISEIITQIPSPQVLPDGIDI